MNYNRKLTVQTHKKNKTTFATLSVLTANCVFTPSLLSMS